MKLGLSFLFLLSLSTYALGKESAEVTLQEVGAGQVLNLKSKEMKRARKDSSKLIVRHHTTSAVQFELRNPMNIHSDDAFSVNLSGDDLSLKSDSDADVAYLYQVKKIRVTKDRGPFLHKRYNYEHVIVLTPYPSAKVKSELEIRDLVVRENQISFLSEADMTTSDVDFELNITYRKFFIWRDLVDEKSLSASNAVDIQKEENSYRYTVDVTKLGKEIDGKLISLYVKSKYKDIEGVEVKSSLGLANRLLTYSEGTGLSAED